MAHRDRGIDHRRIERALLERALLPGHIPSGKRRVVADGEGETASQTRAFCNASPLTLEFLTTDQHSEKKAASPRISPKIATRFVSFLTDRACEPEPVLLR